MTFIPDPTFGTPGTAVDQAFTGVSARTGNDFTAGKTYELVATEDAHFVFGDVACTATTASKFLAAGVPRIYRASDTYVAVIRDSVNGTLFVTPIT